ncbi:MAG: sodium:solute symporter family protein [Clostridiales bacterium]|nr:sodium:solute symporter family protein [Clostridiales bacterium]
MITNALTLLMICAFAFIPLLLGEIAGNRSVLTSEDFILQNRNLKIFPMYATIFATWMSAFAFMGAIAYFYEQGPIYMTTIGWDALFAVLFVIVGRRIWHYGKVHNYMTPVDFLNDIYESKVLNVIVIAITLICTMIYLQVQILGGIIAMNIASGGTIPWYVGGYIFFAILVIYLWAGGLRAVAMTDVFYGILIVTAILSSGFFLMKTAGGTEGVFNKLIEMDPSNVSMSVPKDNNRIFMWLSLFIVVPVGAFMGPQMWIRNYAAASSKNFIIIPWLLCLSSIICIGTLFAGSAGVVLANDVNNPDAILIQLMKEYANPYFYTFIVVGVFATIFSTANSQVHALASVISVDVYKRYINRNASDRRVVSVAKWGVIFVSIASYALVIIVPQSIFDLAVMALGGMAQLIVPVLGALFWKRSSAKAAVFGVLIGEAVFFSCVFLKVGEASVCALSGLLINMFFFVLLAANDKPRIKIYKKIESYRNDYKNRNY